MGKLSLVLLVVGVVIIISKMDGAMEDKGGDAAVIEPTDWVNGVKLVSLFQHVKLSWNTFDFDYDEMNQGRDFSPSTITGAKFQEFEDNFKKMLQECVPLEATVNSLSEFFKQPEISRVKMELISIEPKAGYGLMYDKNVSKKGAYRQFLGNSGVVLPSQYNVGVDVGLVAHRCDNKVLGEESKLILWSGVKYFSDQPSNGKHGKMTKFRQFWEFLDVMTASVILLSMLRPRFLIPIFF